MIAHIKIIKRNESKWIYGNTYAAVVGAIKCSKWRTKRTFHTIFFEVVIFILVDSYADEKHHANEVN